MRARIRHYAVGTVFASAQSAVAKDRMKCRRGGDWQSRQRGQTGRFWGERADAGGITVLKQARRVWPQQTGNG